MNTNFKKDTAAKSYFYFKNCWITVTKNEIKKHYYTEVYEGKKIDADFEIQESIFTNTKGEIDTEVMNCEFAKFLTFFSYNPNSLNEKEFTAAHRMARFESIATAYGYLLDGYKDPTNRKCVFAVDRNDENYGRTGKSIIPKAASFIKMVRDICGKQFNPNYKFRYEPITMDCQIVNFDDMPRNFDVETILEIIADDYTVYPRNKGYYQFLYHESPKVFVSANNKPANHTACMHFIEASDYFNDIHSPYDEFGHALFSDWSPEQWNLFYNTSLVCVMLYKQKGLVPYSNRNIE